MAQDISPRKGARGALQGTRLQGMAVLGGAILLGSTFLSSPASAQSVDELKAQITALSQRLDELETSRVVTPVIAPAQAVTAGSFPGSIKFPGTNTSFKVGGYIKLDAMYTTVPNLGDSFGAGAIPIEGTLEDERGGSTRFHAKQTRFRIVTQTPSDFGMVKTHLEFDFFRNSGANEIATNSQQPRLRHAYGTIGNFMAGQSWTTFMILHTLPDTLDFSGPSGEVFVRQPMVRYTIPFTGGNLQVAAENPQSRIAGLATVPAGLGEVHFQSAGGYNSDKIPDFIAKLNMKGDWGAASLAGVVRTLDFDTGTDTVVGTPGVKLDDQEIAWGLNLGVRLNTFGKDSIAIGVAGGQGIGRYMVGASTASFLEISPTGDPDIELRDAAGFIVSYEHWWAANLHSTAVYGIVGLDNPTSAAPSVDRIQTVYLNLIWSPVAKTTLGVEWMFADVNFQDVPPTVSDGSDAHRVMFSAKWSF